MSEDTKDVQPRLAPESSVPPPKSTNNDASRLAETMASLNLGTAAAIALPPSSPVVQSPVAERRGSEFTLTPMGKLRRTTSSNSLGTTSRSASRSATPTLKTKHSLSSLKGSGGATPPRSPAARRVSSNLALNSHAGMSPKPNLSSPVEEPLPPAPPTAASIAKDYFEREIQGHKDPLSNPDLVVVVHDSCYGHRYSRPRTSKASLSTIVERPERMLATVLGVSAAYVLLGGRHSGGENAPHPQRSSTSIPFKIQKSTRFVPLISPVVTSVHGNRWMAELKMMCEGAEAKLAINGKELIRPVAPAGEKGADDRPKLHEGDLYLCSESLNALEGALGGVLDAIDAVFNSVGPTRAFVGIRPPGHHCSDDYPSGFCWLNNVHVGISHAASVHGLTHAAIIDFDLHHGDGSQAIAWAHNAKVASLPKNASSFKKTAIGYFSLHDINSYPCEWGDEEKVKSASLCVENAHGQTIWNVHLQPWTTDADFWKLYETRYLVLLDKTRAFLQTHYDRLAGSPTQPRAAIFISAGFDASEWESQGMQRHKVSVPTDFYARFTRDINQLADEKGLGADGRVISVLEGGYSDRALMSGVLSHLSGMTNPKNSFPTILSQPGLGLEMGGRLGDLDASQSVEPAPKDSARSVAFDCQWWSPPALEELEAIVNPAPPAAPKKPRGPMNPTYTTPTQSFAAKVVNTTIRRSMSGSQHPRRLSIDHAIPEVGWAVATHELSKILTPDRQTKSCQPEDLNAEATRIRRNRQSTVGVQAEVPIQPGKRMQLRGRKAKMPIGEPESRPASRTNRRQTISSLEPEVNMPDNASVPAKPRHRRVSVASTALSTTEEAPETQAMPPEPSRRPSASQVHKHAPASSVGSDLAIEKARMKPRSTSTQRAPKTVPVQLQVPSVPSTFIKPQIQDPTTKKNDVDTLAMGVKKMNIKLNVPPKKEQEIREKKKTVKPPRKVSSVLKSAKAPSQNPSSTKPTMNVERRPDTQAPVKPKASSDSRPPGPLVSKSNIAAKGTETRSVLGTLPAPQVMPPPHQSPPPTFLPPHTEVLHAPTASTLPPANLHTNGAAAISNPATFTQVPEYKTLAVTAESTPSPHLSTPPKRVRQDLPVFTANSPIIFGDRKVSVNGTQQALKSEGTRGCTDTVNGDLVQEPAAPQQMKEDPVDIWGVPDTPQQRMP